MEGRRLACGRYLCKSVQLEHGMTTSDPRDLPEPAEGVIARPVGDEYVLYDKDTDRAASLTGVSAQVWRAVEGGPSPEIPPNRSRRR